MGHLTRVLRSIRSVSIGFVPSALSYRLVAYCRRASGTYRCMYIYGYAHWGGGRTEVVGTGRRSHHQPINLSCVSMIQTKFVSENKTKFHLLGVMWLYSSVPSRFYLCNTHQWVDKKSKSKSIGDFDSTDKSQTGKSFAPPPQIWGMD